MEQALQVIDEEYRLEQMQQFADQEMNIDEYQVEPATTQCLTDFPILETPEIHETQSRVS